MQQPRTESLSCEHCGEIFQRKEHRDRHLLRHSGMKPFRCSVCSKSFPRRDSLVRHWGTHHSHAESLDNPRRAPQACARCARLKQRCEGGLPCIRCIRQNSRCVHRRASRAEALITQPANVEDAVGGDPLKEGAGCQNGDNDGADNTRRLCQESCGTGGSTMAAPRDSTLQLSQNSSLDAAQFPTLFADDLPDITPATNPPTSSTLDGTAWYQGSWLATSSWSSGPEAYEYPMFDPEEPRTVGFPFLSMAGNLDIFELHMNGAEPPAHASQRHHLSETVSTLSDARDQPHNSAGGAAQHTDAVHGHQNRFQAPLISPTHWRQPCPEFPLGSPDQLQTAETEIFGHVAGIPSYSFEAVRSFYKEQRGCNASRFISVEFFHAFIELYMEYFNPKFPFLHHSKIKGSKLPWVLLLALAAVGSQYSEIRDVHEYSLVLRDLLSRAIEIHIPPRNKWADAALVQSLFLHHVLLFFSGTKANHVTLQFERSMLVSALHSFAPHNKLCQWVDYESEQDLHDEWHIWVSAEEIRRLFYCVHALECLEFVFLDQPPLFHLTDFIQEPPCSDALWQCQSAEEWRAAFRENSDQLDRGASGGSQLKLAESSSQPGCFTRRIHVLELYVDERLRNRQSHSSRVLKSIFANQPPSGEERTGRMPGPSMPTSPRNCHDDDELVDEAINREAYAQLGSRHALDLVVHVLAILRHVPLATLFHSTGWQTDETGMARSKDYLGKFFYHNRHAARKCLWHAAIVFAELRNTRHFACYDALNMCVAVCYIWAFAHFGSEQRHQAQRLGGTNLISVRKDTIRLDTLTKSNDVEKWVTSSGEAEIHIIGVGLLKGSNSRLILLSDASKTLMNQPAWSGLCQCLARAFIKLRHGDQPDMDSE